MLEGLTPERGAVICVGYHSRVSALGVLSHSFMGHEIEGRWLDRRPAGEIGLAHATAAAIGGPVAVLTGDDFACAEMTERDASVRAGAVKYGDSLGHLVGHADRLGAGDLPSLFRLFGVWIRVAASLTNQPPYC
ncbi:M55 family metallopeptidase [Streptomyces incarnatus]